MRLPRSGARRWCSLLACLVLASCAQVGAETEGQGSAAAAAGTAAVAVAPATAPSTAHHTASGFQNTHVASVSRGFADLLRWRWNAWREGLPPPPARPTPVQAPDLALLQGYAPAWQQWQQAKGSAAPAPTVTWIGHASALVQAGGLQVLTDPIFSERASPVSWAGPKRHQAPGVALQDLPPIDVVVISHSHYDHLDKPSLLQLYARAQQQGHATAFLVPLGLKDLLQGWGIAAGVQELDWWQSARVGGTEFFLTPVQHWSARGLFDRNHTLWGGWAVFGPDLHWYFAGDTGYSPDFAQTRQHFADRQTPKQGGGFDLALLPVGAYEPRWFMQNQHVDPAEAVRMHQDLGASRSLGVHWGTFALTDEPLDQPPRDLQAAREAAGLAPAEFFVLAVGETQALTARLAAAAAAAAGAKPAPTAAVPASGALR